MPECLSPINLKHTEAVVPCGKCYNCRLRLCSGWSFRLMQEDKHSLSSYFITLTYDNNNLPRSVRRFRTISKRDVQLFFKRLRKAQTRKYNTCNIKYFAVGEYGSRYARPHYHALIFNADESLIDAAWGLGNVHYGKVSTHSVGYSLKYMFKQSKIPQFKNDDRTPEFRLISNGIGLSYLTKAALSWHLGKETERMYLNLEAGKKCAMPRYYKLKIYSDEQRIKIGQATRERMLLQQSRQAIAEVRISPKYKQAAIQTDRNRMAARSIKSDRF